MIKHKLSVKSADTWLEFEDSKICWHSQINDSIIKSNILIYNNLFFSFFLFFFLTSYFCCLINTQSACIIQLERKNWSGLINNPKFFYIEFYFLSAGLNWYLRDTHYSFYFNNRFFRNLAWKWDHTFRYFIISRKNALNWWILLSQYNETKFSFSSRVV